MESTRTQMLDVSELVATLKSGNQNMSQLIVAVNALGPYLQTILGVSITVGTFTCAANTNTTVTNTAVTASSYIFWTPTNAAGGTLEGSTRKLYLSLRTAGASFRVTTASGVAAGGSETFLYIIVNLA